MSQNPLVSIIVRAKDRPRLFSALQSLAAQTYRPIEVVIVDDGGYDIDVEEAETILGDIALEYSRLERNTGRASAGNVGIKNARGEFIGFLDDDAEFYPSHCAILSTCLQRSGCKVAYSDSETVCQVPVPGRNEFSPMKERNVAPADFSPETLLFENSIPLSSVLFDREVLRNSGGFDESLGQYEDWDLLIRLSSQVPFHHIALTTSAHDERRQDARPAHMSGGKAHESYLGILQKHAEKRSPETVYRYCKIKDEAIRAQAGEIAELRDEKKRLLHACEGIGKTGDSPAETEALALREAAELRKQLEEIHRSFGWRLLSFYRRRIKSSLFPTGTRRGKLYALILASLPLLGDKGIRFVLSKCRNTVVRTVSRKNIDREQYQVPVIREAPADVLPDKVSVVIPTRNAGPDFRYTLERIRGQKRLAEIEIILIDSGSVDGTPSLGERFGARVYSIDPSDFNHGTTRNYGAEQASGSFLIFMSQDAIPIGDFCISETLRAMKQDGGIAVASIQQVPRSDADLFACWQLWFYNNKLLDYRDDSIMCRGDRDVTALSVQERRRIMQLDNVFSCYRKPVFDQFRFRRMKYGEDLDLGIRLIHAGYKLLFMTSVGVIHSHTRDDEYFFQRAYVDTATLLRLLQYEPIDWDGVGIRTYDQMMTYVHLATKRVNRAARNLSALDLGRGSPDTVLQHFKKELLAEQQETRQRNFSYDESLRRIVRQEFGTYRDLHLEYDVLINQFMLVLESFAEYLRAVNFRVSQKNMGEFIDALYKIFSWTCGSNIGNYSVFSEQAARAGK